jgi:hypothetical protein
MFRFVVNACLVALIMALALVAACAPSRPDPVPRATLEPVVARDVVLVAAGSVPDALVADLAIARVVLLGETHYVEEHQAFLTTLLAKLHAAGFRFIAVEATHATAWLGDEYVALHTTRLTRDLSLLNRALLDGLRAFNAGLAEEDRIHFVGVDVNNWAGNFHDGAEAFQLEFGQVAALQDILMAAPDSAAYDAALAALPARLAADRPTIEAALGGDRYALLASMVDVEIRSRPLRTAYDGAAREDVIRDLLVPALAAAGTAGVVANLGMYHAQKSTLMGDTPEVVGTWLAKHPEAYGGDATKLRVIAFCGARGYRLWHFYDEEPWSFDVVREDPDMSLTRILSEHAGAQLAYLPLTDPVFERDVAVDYGHDERVLPIHRQFDAIVLYPTVSVLRSLSN